MKDYTVKQVWPFINTAAHTAKKVLHQQQMPKKHSRLMVPNNEAYEHSSPKKVRCL